ncbi:hydrolase [Bacillus sp. sid0103]|nr:hydrolase [Bacillus sp. sid0103]PGY07405.1 hydrolase [Bacillus sp. AFS031507]
MALSVAVGAVGAVELTHSSVTKASTNENQPIKVDDQSTSKLLTPTNHMLLMIDHQPQMAFGTKSIDVATLRNNVAGLAEAAKTFKVPTVLTTVASKSFSGSIFPEIKKVFPDQKIYDRTSMNAWDDKNVVQAIKDTGKKKIVVAGLWTEVCVVMPVLEALNDGYEVYVVTDASGGVTDQAHNMAVERMVQAGATPITWMQYMLELQRDWANQATYDQVLSIAKEHGGAYGLGIQYAKEMFDTGEGK